MPQCRSRQAGSSGTSPPRLATHRVPVDRDHWSASVPSGADAGNGRVSENDTTCRCRQNRHRFTQQRGRKRRESLRANRQPTWCVPLEYGSSATLAPAWSDTGERHGDASSDATCARPDCCNIRRGHGPRRAVTIRPMNVVRGPAGARAQGPVSVRTLLAHGRWLPVFDAFAALAVRGGRLRGRPAGRAPRADRRRRRRARAPRGAVRVRRARAAPRRAAAGGGRARVRRGARRPRRVRGARSAVADRRAPHDLRHRAPRR